jgi:SAM-dependent methyltransferase
VRAFHEHGWDVAALDFSPAAVEHARDMLGSLADRVVLADFFTHDFGGQTFDLVYERTFLCSLPSGRWPDYEQRMAELLRPGGKLVGFFLYGHEDDPPPYPLTEADAQAILGRHFVRVVDDPVADSLPLFAGRERWQVWKKRIEG